MVSRRKATGSSSKDAQRTEIQEVKVDFAKSGRPPGCKRLMVALTTFLFAAAGTPVWWKTTEINRPCLPSEKIKALNESISTRPLRMPVELTIVVEGQTNPTHYFDELNSEIEKEAVKMMGLLENVDIISVRIIQNMKSACRCSGAGSQETPCLCPKCFSDEISTVSKSDTGEMLENEVHRLGMNDHGKAVLFVLDGEDDGKVWLGAQRTSWTWLPRSKPQKERKNHIKKLGVTLLERFYASGNGAFAEAEGDKLPLSSANELLLSFSLCNPFVSEEYWLWDFHQLEHKWIQGVIQKLDPLIGVGIESQVLYETKPGVPLKRSDPQEDIQLSKDDLPFFVDSGWALDSERTVAAKQHGTNRAAHLSEGRQSTVLRPHLLHWVVFVPSPSIRPLTIVDTPTNAYSIPSWGGVVILNKNCTCLESTRTKCQGEFLSDADLEMIASVFLAQLRGLFGLKETPISDVKDGYISMPAGAAGFADWELDVLIQKRVASDVMSASRTLQALEELMNQLPNLEMPDFIGSQVDQSLKAIQQAFRSASLFDYVACAESAGRARRLAEEAFSHPSILAQLNFPDQHKIAMYLPFFLPAGSAVLMALGSELKRFIKRKQASSKWQAEHAKSD